jgi:hypothetical protein
MRLTRREFLAAALATPVASTIGLPSVRTSPHPLTDTLRAELGFPIPHRLLHGESSVAAALRASAGQTGGRRRDREERPEPLRPEGGAARYLRTAFPDLRRHFVFEYYPWYGTNPWVHWNDAERHPPHDIAASAYPLLGPYDSRDAHVLEQHARWMASAGVGAINISWWGRGSWTDEVTPLVMDVMRAHDIHVTFHLEPYHSGRAESYRSDILYLLRTYGEQRRWDNFLLLKHGDGTVGPVFKSFRTILPRQVTDCHGLVHQVPDWTADDSWRRQTDRIREEVRGDFDRVTLLADSLDMARTRAGGFDGIAVYDNYVKPDEWRRHATNASNFGLLFSFNTNPGFDGIEPRTIPPDSCYRPSAFEPPAGDLDFSSRAGRAAATRLADERIADSFRTSVALQTSRELLNARRGFFLVYINSFNEWHEGTQFEPMKNAADLPEEARRFEYHNVDVGGARLSALAGHIRSLA